MKLKTATTALLFCVLTRHAIADTVTVELNFLDNVEVPSSMIVYWPEDTSLENRPMIDHKEGEFTERLIVGAKNSTIQLKNSDEVGHTIYVKDKRQKVRWQLDYMPPHSQFTQELYWEEDVFVEMKCRLHRYMSAWVGSISTSFFTVFLLEEGKTQYSFSTDEFPTEFSEVKVWMPKHKPLQTKLLRSQSSKMDLMRGSSKTAEITLSRS